MVMIADPKHYPNLDRFRYMDGQIKKLNYFIMFHPGDKIILMSKLFYVSKIVFDGKDYSLF